MVDLELRRYQSTNFEPSTNFVMDFSSISEIVDTCLQYFFSTKPNLQIFECLQFFTVFILSYLSTPFYLPATINPTPFLIRSITSFALIYNVLGKHYWDVYGRKVANHIPLANTVLGVGGPVVNAVLSLGFQYVNKSN